MLKETNSKVRKQLEDVTKIYKTTNKTKHRNRDWKGLLGEERMTYAIDSIQNLLDIVELCT